MKERWKNEPVLLNQFLQFEKSNVLISLTEGLDDLFFYYA